MPAWLHWVMLILVLYLLWRVYRLEKYIGTNAGAPASWSGLSGWTRQTTLDLRNILDDFKCRLYRLELDYPPTSPKPDPCPPGGPPGTIPKDDPNYPP